MKPQIHFIKGNLVLSPSKQCREALLQFIVDSAS